MDQSRTAAVSVVAVLIGAAFVTVLQQASFEPRVAGITDHGSTFTSQITGSLDLQVGPPTVRINKQGSISHVVSLTSSGGFSGDVSVSVSGLPPEIPPGYSNEYLAGYSCGSNCYAASNQDPPFTVTVPGDRTIAIFPAASPPPEGATPGIYTLTFTASVNGQTVDTATTTLIVEDEATRDPVAAVLPSSLAGGPAQDYKLYLDAGQSATRKIGYNASSDVRFDDEGAPYNVYATSATFMSGFNISGTPGLHDSMSGSFSSGSATLDSYDSQGTVDFTVTTSSDTPSGDYVVLLGVQHPTDGSFYSAFGFPVRVTNSNSSSSSPSSSAPNASNSSSSGSGTSSSSSQTTSEQSDASEDSDSSDQSNESTVATSNTQTTRGRVRTTSSVYRMAVTPSQASLGDTVTVTGSGFTANQPMTLVLDPSIVRRKDGSAGHTSKYPTVQSTTSSSGTVRAEYTIPEANMFSGTHSLRLTNGFVGERDGEQSITTNLTVNQGEKVPSAYEYAAQTLLKPNNTGKEPAEHTNYVAQSLAASLDDPTLTEPFENQTVDDAVTNPPRGIKSASAELGAGCSLSVDIGASSVFAWAVPRPVQAADGCQSSAVQEADQRGERFDEVRTRHQMVNEYELAAKIVKWKNPMSLIDIYVSEWFTNNNISGDREQFIQTRLEKDFLALTQHPDPFDRKCQSVGSKGGVIVLYKYKTEKNDAGTDIPVYWGGCSRIANQLSSRGEKPDSPDQPAVVVTNPDGVVLSSTEMAGPYNKYAAQWDDEYEQALSWAIGRVIGDALDDGVVLRITPDGRGVYVTDVLGDDEDGFDEADQDTVVNQVAASGNGQPTLGSVMVARRPRTSWITPAYADDESDDDLVSADDAYLTNYIDLAIEGPAHALLLTDPSGRSVGKHLLDGSTLQQRDDVVYTGDGSTSTSMLIPGIIEGQYQLAILGLEDGDYTGTLRIAIDDKVVTRSFSGTLTKDHVTYETFGTTLDVAEPFEVADSSTNRWWLWIVGIVIVLGLATPLVIRFSQRYRTSGRLVHKRR